MINETNCKIWSAFGLNKVVVEIVKITTEFKTTKKKKKRSKPFVTDDLLCSVGLRNFVFLFFVTRF